MLEQTKSLYKVLNKKQIDQINQIIGNIENDGDNYKTIKIISRNL